MSESEPMCLRAIVDATDSTYREDIEEIEVLEAFDKAYVGPGLTRDKKIERMFLKCQVPECPANCFLLQSADGEILYEIDDEVSIDPVPEEHCVKLHSNPYA